MNKTDKKNAPQFMMVKDLDSNCDIIDQSSSSSQMRTSLNELGGSGPRKSQIKRKSRGSSKPNSRS